MQSIKKSLDAAGITSYERFFDKAELAELGIINTKPVRKAAKKRTKNSKREETKHDEQNDTETQQSDVL